MYNTFFDKLMLERLFWYSVMLFSVQMYNHMNSALSICKYMYERGGQEEKVVHHKIIVTTKTTECDSHSRCQCIVTSRRAWAALSTQSENNSFPAMHPNVIQHLLYELIRAVIVSAHYVMACHFFFFSTT